MYHLYILQSEKNGRYYIGSTSNLVRRLSEHNSGKTLSLRFLLPLKLVFSQKYPSLIHARAMEQKLKKFKNKDILERIIKDKKITTGL